MIRTYLDWLIAVPWSERSEERLDPVHAREVLDADHAGLEDVKDRIVEYIGVLKLRQERGIEDGQALRRDPHPDRPARHGQDVDRRVDRPRHRPRVRAHVAGRRARRGRDPRPPAHLHRRAAGPAGPGAARRRDDEPGDHARRGRQGRRRLARRPVARPCSRCSTRRRTTRSATTTWTWSWTCRRCCSSPPPTWPTRSPRRCSTAWRSCASTATPTEEKVAIARGYLWPRQRERNGLREDEVAIDDDVLRTVVTEYTREAGVRNLERELGTVLRKTATQHRLRQGRGAGRGRPGRACATPSGASASSRRRPSARRCRAWPPAWRDTPVGGDVLFIEATSMTAARTAWCSPASSAT